MRENNLKKLIYSDYFLRKVFSDFVRKQVMATSKRIIPVIVGIVIIGIIVAAISMSQDSGTMEVEDTVNKEIRPVEDVVPEIEQKIKEIEETKKENEYSPKPREWMASGPFQVDRKEYVLGEKIFIRASGLSYDEKGQVAVLRPLNNTHYSVYLTIPFDGADKPSFNYYLEPQLSKIRGFCTADDFVGEWTVVFRGTDYPNLKFSIIEEVLPGEEEDYKPVC